MRKLLFIIILFSALQSYGQQAQLFGAKDYTFPWSVNIGAGKPKATHPSAYMELGDSTFSKKGFLPPRGWKDSVKIPIKGMIIHDIQTNKPWWHNGVSWQEYGLTSVPWSIILDKPTEFTPASGSSYYIRNQNSALQPSNFWVSTGKFSGSNTATGVTIGQTNIDFGNSGVANSITSTSAIGFNISNSGNVLNLISGNGVYINPNGTGAAVIGTTGNVSAPVKLYVAGTISTNSQLYLAQLATAPDALYNRNGAIYFGTADNQFKGYRNGWNNFLMSGDAIAAVNGGYVYVDGNNPSATDTRTGLNKYSLHAPFKTVQAAVNAASFSDWIVVKGPYTYSENVTIADIRNIIVERGATISGGTSYALYYSYADQPSASQLYILHGGAITNTGNASNRNATSAVYLPSGAELTINGTGGSISSVEGCAVYQYISNMYLSISNVSLSSTNTNAYASPFVNSHGFTNCTITSTNSTAIQHTRGSAFTNCTITGATALDFGNWSPAFTVNNCTIRSTNNYAFYGSGVFGPSEGNNSTATIINSTITGTTGIFFGQNNNQTSVNYGVKIEHCRLNVTTGSSAFNITGVTSGGPNSKITLTDNFINVPFFTDAFRATTEGLKIIKENNTNIKDSIQYYTGNLRVGKLKSTLTAPATVGTVKMVTVDTLGNFSNADIPSGSAQVNADWNATSGAAQILNKPGDLTTFTPRYTAGSGVGDANIAIPVGQLYVELGTITASNNLTVGLSTSSTSAGQTLHHVIANTNTNATYNWTYSATVKKADGTTVTEIPKGKSHTLFYNGSFWMLTSEF